MPTLVTEILLSCLILSLLIFVIPSFHQASRLIDEVSGSYAEKVQIPSYLPHDQALGIDVISLIDYYADQPDVSIIVCQGHTCKTYTQGAYAEDPFGLPIELTQMFLMEVDYLDQRITSIHFNAGGN